MRVIQIIIQLLQTLALTAGAYVLPMVLATISTIDPPAAEVATVPVRSGTFAARIDPDPPVTPGAPVLPTDGEPRTVAHAEPTERAQLDPTPATPGGAPELAEIAVATPPVLHDHCVARPIEGVEQLSARRFKVDRELVEFYSRHPAQARQSATLSWNREGGRIDGFRLHRIRCGSLLYAIGLRSEDVVHSVNGREITSLGSALLAATRLGRRDALRVRVSRDGEIVKMRYKLS